LTKLAKILCGVLPGWCLARAHIGVHDVWGAPRRRGRDQQALAGGAHFCHGAKRLQRAGANPVYIALGRGLTFSWFAFTLFWFWADWKQIDRNFAALGVMQWFGVWLAIWLFSTIALTVWESLRQALLSIRTSGDPVLTNRYARVVYASALGLIAVLITVLLNQPAPDIVYKAF